MQGTKDKWDNSSLSDELTHLPNLHEFWVQNVNLDSLYTECLEFLSTLYRDQFFEFKIHADFVKEILDYYILHAEWVYININRL